MKKKFKAENVIDIFLQLFNKMITESVVFFQIEDEVEFVGVVRLTEEVSYYNLFIDKCRCCSFYLDTVQSA